MKKTDTFSPQTPRLFPQVQFNRDDLQYHIIFWLIVSVLHLINFVYTKSDPSDIDRHDGFIDMGITFFATVIPCYLHTYFLLPRTFGDVRLSLTKATYLYGFFLVLLIAYGCNFYSALGTFLKDEGVFLNTQLAHDSIRTLPEMFFNMYLLTGLVYLRKWFHSSVEISLQKDILEKEHQLSKQLQRAERYKIMSLNWRMPHHFLFNCLNSIYIATIKNPSSAQEKVLKLSRTMEYLTYDSNKPSVSLNQEIQLIKNYLSMSLDGFDPKTFEREEDFDKGISDEVRIAPLLLIPFVENAVKHGIERTENRKWMKLQLKVDEHNVLHFKIKNSQLTDADMSRLETKIGVGIADTRQRLKLAYPNSHELTLNSDGDTFKMSLKIELDKLNTLNQK